MRDFIIGVDVDDVVADLLGPWLARYNARFNDSVKLEDVIEWDVTKFVKPECGQKIFELIDPSVYEEVSPLPGALETVTELRKLGRVVFITAGNADAKQRWLVKHGFLNGDRASLHDYVSCTDKALINADVLIDDHVKNIEAFPGHALLVTRFHNAQLSCSRLRLETFEESIEVVANLRRRFIDGAGI